MNIVVYTNILTPYRKHFFDTLYEELKKRGDNFYVLIMAETEPNRKWNYKEYKTNYTILLESKTYILRGTYIHVNRKILSIIKKLNVNILICGGSYYCPGVWKAANNKKKLNYLCLFWSESHLEELKEYSISRKIFREIIRKKIYSKFDGFWYAGKMSLNFIKKYENKKAKICHIFVPNLVDESKYKSSIEEEKIARLRMEYGINNDRRIFFCAARLERVKGIDKFLKILYQCANRSRVTMLIAGDGGQREELLNLIDQLGLDVHLLGFKNQNEIIDLYSMADVFILPSISDPNPLSCIEALWSGLPLFISKHVGNHPEVVIQGRNGFVYDYEDEVKQILEELIDKNENWYKQAKKISYELAEKNYSTKTAVKRIVDEIYQIVGLES